MFDLEIPVLGICYGSQMMAHLLGGKVATAPVSEYGRTEVEVDAESGLFQGVARKTICWMSHTDYIEKAPEGFTVTLPYTGLSHSRYGRYRQGIICGAVSPGSDAYAGGHENAS